MRQASNYDVGKNELCKNLQDILSRTNIIFSLYNEGSFENDKVLLSAKNGIEDIRRCINNIISKVNNISDRLYSVAQTLDARLSQTANL